MFGYNIKTKLTNICKGNKNQDELITMFIDFSAQLVHTKSPEQYRNIILKFEEINIEDISFALYSSSSNRSSLTTTSSTTPPPPPPPSSSSSSPSPTPSPRTPSTGDPQTTIENMKKSLEMIRLQNIIINRVYEMKNESFDVYRSDHLLLLNEFWNNLKPDRLRGINPLTNEVDSNIISSDWIEIGFQGNDPSTDFRGMGILGLQQLYYFSKNRNQVAKLILTIFTQDKTKYYPFAIIGINITRFLLELINELRIQKLLIENLGHIFAAPSKLMNYNVLPSNDNICIEFGINLINDIYCIIFEEFYLQWVIVNPANIMAFNTIFDQVKASIRQKYESLFEYYHHRHH